MQNKTLKGKESIQFVNASPDSFKEIYLNLNMNAFSNLSSSLMREALLWNCFRENELKDYGWIEINSIRFENNEIKENLLFISPDDGNQKDRTLAKINLPSPILPGRTATLEIEFSTKLPSKIMGIGYIGNFFLFSHWYPRICPIEEREGKFFWNYNQFHFPSIFNPSFASYKVEVNLPRKLRVGATGIKTYEKKSGSKKTVRFYAEDVSDFLWVASPSFLEYKDYFIPEKEFSPAKLKELERIEGSTIDKIKISLLLRPERKIYKDRYLKTIKEAIRDYTLLFSKYPFQSLTFVDFPALDEFSPIVSPDLILIDHPLFSPEDSFHLKKNILRSLGSHYWDKIGVNGIEESWLGNGLTSYSEFLLMKESLNEPVIYRYFSFIPIPYIELLNLPLFGFHFTKMREKVEFSLLRNYLKEKNSEPISKKTWEFLSFNSYKVNTNIKPTILLITIEKNYGRKKVISFLREYFKRYYLKKPKKEDFLNLIETEIGTDARNLLEHFLFNKNSVDFRIVEVRNRILKENGKKLFLSSVLLEKDGDLIFPVDIEVSFKDGKKIMERWDGKGNWVKFIYKRDSEINKVVIDPHQKFLLDGNIFNNSLLLKKNRASFFKVMAIWYVLIEEFFHNLCFFI